MTPILNPVVAADAITILRMTPPRRRWKVLFAFCGLTSHQFSKLIGIHGDSLNRWRNNRHQINFVHMEKIAEVFGFPFEAVKLLTEREEEESWNPS